MGIGGARQPGRLVHRAWNIDQVVSGACLGVSWRYQPIWRPIITTIIALGVVALVFLALNLL